MKNKFALLALITGCILNAAPSAGSSSKNVFDSWRYAAESLHKIPEAITVRGNTVTLKSVSPKEQLFFRPGNALKVTRNDQVEIKFTASGKGSIKVGFYAYVRGFSFCGSALKVFQVSAGRKTETIHLNVPANATIVRPVIMVMPGSSVTFFEHSIKVLLHANPQLNIVSTLSKETAVYKKNEKAVFTVTVRNGYHPVKTGKAVIRVFHDGFERRKLHFDLSEKNPFQVEFTSDKPGFVELFCDVYHIPGKKDRKRLAVGCAGFSPEQIRIGAEPPADLLTYWKGEYAKLCREVPPDFKLSKVRESASHIDYKLTCSNFGGTKTYATLTIPRRKGPLPMFFNVPPASPIVYGFHRRPDAICLCISVHDTDSYTSFKAYQADMRKNSWYFYRTGNTRSSYYYYKSILGVMRMMEYAMTHIKEWDGKYLAAGGRSQGGGFAMIMAALNPRIQAVYADVPALCDHNAGRAGRVAGWPQLSANPRGKKLPPEDAMYYDAAAFAAFVKCPAVVSVGFEDTMCYPSSVYAPYNNLKGPKQIIHCVRYGHGWGERGPEFEKAAWKLIHNTLCGKQNFK